MRIRTGRPLVAATVAVLALAGASAALSAAPAGAAADVATGTYYQVDQQRVLDTRSGLGAPKAAVGHGATLAVQVTGTAGIPSSGVSAVVLNLTAVAPVGSTYVIAYPTGSTRPNVSSLNLPSGSTRANLVTVPVGTGGQVSLYNAGGSVNLLADVYGFYAADDSLQASLGMGRQFQLADPVRLYDSRKDPKGALAAGEVVGVGADFGSTINPTVRALAVNVTVVSPSRAGYLQVYPMAVQTPPNTSALNFTAGQIVPNMVVATSSLDQASGVPAINVRNASSGTAHVLVDLVGFYDQDATEGLRFKPLTPTRIVDTRTGAGGAKTPIGPGVTRRYAAPGAVAGTDTFAMVANLTAVQPTASTYLTVWDGTSSRPATSNLNAPKGAVVANAAVVALDDSNRFNIYNNVGSTPTILDVSGTFEYHKAPAAAPSTGSRTSSQTPSALAPVAGRTLVRRHLSGPR